MTSDGAERELEMAHNWSVGEDLAALHLYLRLGGGLEEYEHPNLLSLA